MLIKLLSQDHSIDDSIVILKTEELINNCGLKYVRVVAEWYCDTNFS